jgi:hypothetical protein
MSLLRSTVTMLALLVTVTGVSRPVTPIHRTPTSTGGCQIEPYAEALGGNMLDRLKSVGDQQGYDIEYLVETQGGLNPSVTLEDFVSHLAKGDGIIFWGHENGVRLRWRGAVMKGGDV